MSGLRRLLLAAERASTRQASNSPHACFLAELPNAWPTIVR
jgi:hypothetical protein